MPEGDPATLDPHVDAYSPVDTWELFRVSHTNPIGQKRGRGGARIHQDLARKKPAIPANRLSLAHLKQGLPYAPPMKSGASRSRTSCASFHRLLEPRFQAAGACFPGYLCRHRGREVVLQQATPRRSPAWRRPTGTPLSSTRLDEARRRRWDADRPGHRRADPTGTDRPSCPLRSCPRPQRGTAGHYLVSSRACIIGGWAQMETLVPPEEKTPIARGGTSQRISLVRNPSWDSASDDLRLGRA